MANTTIDLVGLDFNSLKNNLKSFLQNNTQFKDLDYEGSNIGVLLDVLAYNTYLNAFYTNMVASEMFLDTAQLRDSVVSHAKELNYTPRSFASSQAEITVDITPTSNVTSIVVPKYTSFTSRVGSNTYTFSTQDTQILSSSSNGVYSTILTVYEGTLLTESFVINSSNNQQRFVISNPTVDTSSLNVQVYEDGGQNIISYVAKQKIIDITDQNPIFFVQGAENQQYEIVFGDNIFGRKPKDGSTIVVQYRASSGELPNGALVFAPDSAIDGHTNINVTGLGPAAGGAIGETIESIRFNAPRNFQAQDRAVTAHDYEVLLQSKFSDIQAISAYGGEDVDPPQYGKVFIAVDLHNTQGASDARKMVFKQYIVDRSPLTIDVAFVSPSFLYAKVITNVFFNTRNTNKTSFDISTAVRAAISNYSLSKLETFKANLFYSNLVNEIDRSDLSIVSNDTSVAIAMRFVPRIGIDNIIIIETFNELQSNLGVGTSSTDPRYGEILTSSFFTYQNTKCILVDDMLGNIFFAARRTGYVDILKRTGSIDYKTGKISMSGFNVDSYEGNYIELLLVPKSKNINGYKNVIVSIDPLDVTVNVIGVN